MPHGVQVLSSLENIYKMPIDALLQVFRPASHRALQTAVSSENSIEMS